MAGTSTYWDFEMFAGAGGIRFEDRGWDLELRDDTAPWAVD